MTNDHGRLIRNLYYMLAYAFSDLKRQADGRGGVEDFENIYDLAAALLSYGLSRQLKEGLLRRYEPVAEELQGLRGRLSMAGTMRLRTARRTELACEFDEFSADNIYNRLLKATVLHLLRPSAPPAERPRESLRLELRKLLPLLEGISDISIPTVSWNRVPPPPRNSAYGLLLAFCRIVWENQLFSPHVGDARSLPIFKDEAAMSRLFELFVLNYYKRHHPGLRAEAAHIRWAVDPTPDGAPPPYLPNMRTDITLHSGGKTLIIDAKYYRLSLQRYLGAETLRNAHLNQLLAYVYNYALGNPDRHVGGLLLYARTQETHLPVTSFSLEGRHLSTLALDLNRPFEEIAATLDDIAKRGFGEPNRIEN